MAKHRIDPLFGLLQNTVFLSRVGSGETKTLKGKVVPLREHGGAKPKFGQRNTWDVMTGFARSKFSPSVSVAVNTAVGKDLTGAKFGVEDIPKQMMVPITYQDIYEAGIQQGIPEKTIFTLLSIFGAGVQTHDNQPRR